MIKTKISLVNIGIFLCFQFLYSQPISVKSCYQVIVDTDCGIEDYRAISLLLYNKKFNLIAITVSDGILSPDQGLKKVNSLLQTTGRGSVPTAQGKTHIQTQPEFRVLNNNISWGTEPDIINKPISSFELYSGLLKNSQEKITILAMGPLTNIAELIITQPEVLNQIDRIVWFNEDLDGGTGFNYLIDSVSAKTVLQSGLRIDIISNLGKPEALFDLSVSTCKQEQQSMLLDQMKLFYTFNSIPLGLHGKQAFLKEELLILYLANPELFSVNTMIGNRMLRYNTEFNISALREVLRDMLQDTYYYEQHIVFSKFPTTRQMFNYDVRLIMDQAIERYGLNEWKASVITNELHGHLGIYSIIGVKMGIRALEILEAQRDALRIVSYSGMKPPYSCLNDGLQVSTGATLGMNLISVKENDKPVVMADFIHENTTIRLTLKQEYSVRIESDITEGILKFGLSDDGYWKLLRQSALKYWKDWDRSEIFEVEILKNEIPER